MFHESVPIKGLPLTRFRSVFLAMIWRVGTKEWNVFSFSGRGTSREQPQWALKKWPRSLTSGLAL